MNPSEQSALRYLASNGFNDIVHEPDGNVPPDFLLAGRVAVEVRRLNEGEDTGGGHRGLEEVSKPLHALITKTLTAMGPSPNGVSWFVHFTYRRPLPPWKSLRGDLATALATLKGRSDLQDVQVRVSKAVQLSFIRASKSHPTLFLLGGSSDRDSGGFVVAELATHLKIYIAEKAQKIERVRHKYSEWWLVFEDRVGYGVLDDADQRELRKLIRVESPWSRIILVNPMNPTSGFDL